jgi:hypothetical protein
VRAALGGLLDAVAARDGNVKSALEAFTNSWLESRGDAKGFDWRWYFVRRPEMRTGKTLHCKCSPQIVKTSEDLGALG